MLTARSSPLFADQKREVFELVRFLPEDLRWTPVKCKRPCDGDDWQKHPYSLFELLQLPFNYTGLGLMTGPVSNAMVLDLDGPGHERTFLHHMKRELAALPPTVSWSSGRPHRHSRLYRVPAEWWGRITGGKELDLEGASKFELRAHGQQAVMVGKHPNDKITGAPGEPCQKVGPGEGDGQGFYDWLEGSSPAVIEVADAPEWLLERWAELCTPRGRQATSTEVRRPRKSREELDYDLSRVSYLQQYFQPANEYSDYWTWLHIGMELHSLSCDCGDPWKLFAHWREWCSDMLNFDPAECEEKWESFGRKPGERTFASFIHRAQQHPKWVGPKPQERGDDARPAEDDEASKAEKIKEIYADLYRLEKEGDPAQKHWRDYRRSQLLARRLNRDEIDQQLLMMAAAEHGLRIGEGGQVVTRHRSLATATTAAGNYNELLPGFVHKGKDVLLFGASGSGKTLAGLAITYAVSSGHTPFLDMAEGTAPPDRGPALWIGSDGGEGAHAMVKDYAGMLQVSGRAHWDHNFTFWGADEETGEQPWGFNVAGIHRLCTELERGHPNGDRYAVIVLDTLKAVMDLGGINYTGPAMGTAMRLMQAIAAKYQAAAVWLHHPSKSNRGADTGISGSGGNSNIYEVPFAVHNLYKVPRQGHDHVTRWKVEKFRGNAGRVFDYVLDRTNGLFEILKPETGTEADVLEAVFGHNDGGVSSTELADALNMQRKTLYNTWLTPLRKKGLIRTDRQRWYLDKAGALRLAELMPEKLDTINKAFGLKPRVVEVSR